MKNIPTVINIILDLIISAFILYILFFKEDFSIMTGKGDKMNEKEVSTLLSSEGEITLIDKKTGNYIILSDSLSRNIMLIQLKVFYVEELKRTGKLSELNNIEEFFEK